MSRSLGSSRRCRRSGPSSRSSNQRVEENAGRTPSPAATPRRPGAGPARHPQRLVTWAGPRLGVDDRARARRLPSRVHDATNPGPCRRLHARTPQVILVSLCLADECHRPNCQGTELNGPQKVYARTRARVRTALRQAPRPIAVHRRHRPVRGCPQATHPGRRPTNSFDPLPPRKWEKLDEVTVMLPQKPRRSTLHPSFLQNQDRKPG
jgi:hypothetical protein